MQKLLHLIEVTYLIRGNHKINRADLETGVFFVKITFDDMLEFMKFEMNVSLIS